MDIGAVVTAYGSSWNEPDEAARRQLLESAWADDGTYCDPTASVEGREALVAHIGAMQVHARPHHRRGDGCRRARWPPTFRMGHARPRRLCRTRGHGLWTAGRRRAASSRSSDFFGPFPISGPVMSTDQPAVAIIGSGIAGSALAAALASAGVRVLLLERTEQFVDHVRGRPTPGGWRKRSSSGCMATSESGAR